MGVPQPNPPQRPIAELIGRQKVRSLDLAPGDVVEDPEDGLRVVVEREERQPGNWGWKTQSGWFSDKWFEQCARHVVHPPTPDDMLAWLRERIPFLMFDGNWHGGGYELTVHSMSESIVFGTHQPTFAAALEDIVRQRAAGGVVGETEPADPEATT